MDLMQAIEERHAVRYYTDQKIEGLVEKSLRQLIDECNAKSGLHMQLCLNEPQAFDSILARYGVFTNVNNYIALVGKKIGDQVEEQIGYYGEKVVLEAQIFGLNTCWVGGTYSKRKTKAKVSRGEKLYLVIAIGYGEKDGSHHKTRSIEEMSRIQGDMPDWFRRGMEAVLLAPSAMNQQKSRFSIVGDGRVRAESLSGFYARVDLGIAKLHFEIGAAAAGAQVGVDWQWD